MRILDLSLVVDADFPEAASPFLDVSINGETCSALLDTGAATSSVTHRPGLTTRLVPATGTGLFGVHHTDDRRAGVNVAIGGIDLGIVDVEVVSPEHPGHGNLIGQDILGRWCCEYRLGNQQLVLDAPPLAEGTPIAVGGRGHIILDVEWPGGVKGQALFDTGASLSVVDLSFADAHPHLFRVDGTVGGIDADGSTGETPVLHMAGPRLLGSTFAESLAVGVDLKPIQRSDATFDMIVGWPLLHHGSFTIDTRNRLGRHRL